MLINIIQEVAVADLAEVVALNNEEEKIFNTPSRSPWRIYTRGRQQSFLFKSQCCVPSVKEEGRRTRVRSRSVRVAEDRVSKLRCDKLPLEWFNRCNRHAPIVVELVK